MPPAEAHLEAQLASSRLYRSSVSGTAHAAIKQIASHSLLHVTRVRKACSRH